MRKNFLILLLVFTVTGMWALFGRHPVTDFSEISQEPAGQEEKRITLPLNLAPVSTSRQITQLGSGTSASAPEASGPIHTPSTEPAVLKSGALIAGTVDRDGLVRDDRGALQTMRHEDALNWCASHRMHLATIRELVTWGSKVISIEKIEEIQIPPGFSKELIRATNPDGTKDEFYITYNSSGGNAGHEGDVGKNWFFSSSVDTDHPYEFWAFDGRSNYIPVGELPDPDSKYHNAGVRCLPNPEKGAEAAPAGRQQSGGE